MAMFMLAGLSLTGCGGEPFAYQPDHELKPGSGLHSGDKGEFTLLGSPKKDGVKASAQQQ